MLDKGEHIYYCANCLVPIRSKPVMRGGQAYCCRGCAAGGPCICSYVDSDQPAASSDQGERARVPGDESGDGASGLGASRPPVLPASTAERTDQSPDFPREDVESEDRLASGRTEADDSSPAPSPPAIIRDKKRPSRRVAPGPAYRETIRSALDDLLSACLRLMETLEETKQPAQPLAGTPQREELPGQGRIEGEEAAVTREKTASGQPAGPAQRRAEAEEAEEGLRDLNEQRERFCLLVRPVKKLDSAQELASELEELPLVCMASLFNFVPDDAAYEVETPDKPRLLQFLVCWPRLEPKHARISPACVELVLPQPYTPLPKTEVATEPPAPLPSTPPAEAVPGPAATGGVMAADFDVFFDARHFTVLDGQQGLIHPHAWRVQAKIAGLTDGASMPVIPFAEAKRLLQGMTDRYKDSLLNATPPFDLIQPTPDNVAAVFYKELSAALNPLPMRLISLSVCESPVDCASYSAEELNGAEA